MNEVDNGKERENSGPEGIKADRAVDVKGFNCPIPVLSAKKELSGMQAGQVLEVLTTDPGARPDMISFADRYGHDILEVRGSAGAVSFFIRKGPSGE